MKNNLAGFLRLVGFYRLGFGQPLELLGVGGCLAVHTRSCLISHIAARDQVLVGDHRRSGHLRHPHDEGFSSGGVGLDEDCSIGLQEPGGFERPENVSLVDAQGVQLVT